MSDHDEYRWALPAVLLGDGSAVRPVRRSTRDWIVDIAMFLAACGITLLTAPELEGLPRPLMMIEQVAGVLSCVAVWLRRRWPVWFAMVTTVLSTFLLMVGGAAVVGMFTVAVHRPFKVAGPVAAFAMLTLGPYVMLHPDPDLGPAGTMTLSVAILLTVFAWGVVVRARRQLVWSLRQRAVIAAEEAKRLERERIAREMHDVLAHRISMLSLHAGALEFRPGAPPEEISRAAGAIRHSAHQALQDLREVIGVLRHPSSSGDENGPVPAPPQPTLADLRSLVEECRQAGMKLSFTMDGFEGAGVRGGPGGGAGERAADGLGESFGDGVGEGAGDGAGERFGDVAGEVVVSDGLGRTVYRVVQEALTNARKHGGGAPVSVTVAGRPGDGVTVEVRNAVWARQSPRIPGAGAGLIGLTERVELAGGRLEFGPGAGGDFRLHAWLPWTP
ncbi:sensor histidine kinase [Nonomuraea roseoviolacea]|uniref:histidine kinase n=1 Tax=Nonomuraea roseoviolacea subsp. carminata TaxID=160689 RepID=A0ABT1JSN5_9ACTN|nr:histidine kinase [Nonomuraea roseoviolacea]MCP2344442.1 signal transduction histidine kinase [Nonomuraea roseoviolacea subsp. carminata]